MKAAFVFSFSRMLSFQIIPKARSTNKNKNNTNHKWLFFYEPDYQKKDSDLAMYVNLADYIINYPDTVIDCANRVLKNLSVVYPLYGDEIVLDPHFHRLLFGKTGIFDILQDLGFVKQGLHGYIITADGWKRIDELKKKEIVLKQGFIAMWFDKSTTSIREAFREAIRESGYNERVIDEKEHNNQIVPEILFEIERSKFNRTLPFNRRAAQETSPCLRHESIQKDRPDKKPGRSFMVRRKVRLRRPSFLYCA